MKVFGYRHHKRKERHQNELGFFPVCSRQVETPETLRYLRDDLSHPAHCFPVAPGKDLAAWKSWIAILPLPRMTRVTLVSLFNELITNWARISFPLVPPDSQFFFFFLFFPQKEMRSSVLTIALVQEWHIQWMSLPFPFLRTVALLMSLKRSNCLQESLFSGKAEYTQTPLGRNESYP